MSLAETIRRVADRIPLLRRTSQRTRANVVGGVLVPLPVATAMFLGTYVTPAATALWILTGSVGALYAGVFGDDVRAERVAARGFVSPGMASEAAEFDGDAGKPLAVVVAGGYAGLTILGLYLRYALL